MRLIFDPLASPLKVGEDAGAQAFDCMKSANKKFSQRDANALEEHQAFADELEVLWNTSYVLGTRSSWGLGFYWGEFSR